MKRWIAGGLAAVAFAAAFAAPVPPAEEAGPGERSLAETLLLLRWGHGALGAPASN